MNKVSVCVLAALCACAFAGSITPKIPECSLNMLIDITVSEKGVTFTYTSSAMALYKGDELYRRMNASFMIMTIDSVTRCDVKKDGKCLEIDHSNGECEEYWVDPDLEYDDPIYYDSESDVDCPDGGKCKKYCNSTEQTCYTINSDDMLVGTESEDMSTVIHYQSGPLSPDVFIVERCDGTKLGAPADPCAPEPSSHSSGKPSSSHVDPSSHADPSGNPSSSHVDSPASVSVPSALVALLVAVLVALF